MTHAILSYFRFLIRSKNHHSVHSPFVFNFVTKCLYDKKKYDDYNSLNSYRKYLYKHQDFITMTDLGAGSRKFKTNQRPIRSIARNAGLTHKRSQILYRISRYFDFNSALELGTSLGLASQAIALGKPSIELHTIEGCPETSKFAKRELEFRHLNQVNFHIGDFDQIIQEKFCSTSFDLIYFDGNHTKDATLRYFELLLSSAHNDSVWIFDDIHWSKEMEEAWEIIQKNNRVTVTIDTYQWGFVFFRKEQEKEHFILRV